MILSGSKTTNRIALLLSTGFLGACISLASTLPGPAPEKAGDTVDTAPASLLPEMMDASVSYTDTANASPVTAPGAVDTAAAMETSAAPVAALNARVASGELIAGASDTAQPDHKGCMPEPVSMVLMTGGLLGLIAARRFRR